MARIRPESNTYNLLSRDVTPLDVFTPLIPLILSLLPPTEASTQPQIPTPNPPPMDPFRALGDDLAHQILGYLCLPDLLAAEAVSRSWASQVRCDAGLWRTLCLEAGVSVADVNRLSWQGRSYSSVREGGSVWRRLCIDHTRSQGAFQTGTWTRETFEVTDAALEHIQPLPELKALVALSPTAETGTISVRHGIAPEPVIIFPSQDYIRIAVGEGYVVAERCPMQRDGALPVAAPTELHYWTAIKAASTKSKGYSLSLGENGTLQYLGIIAAAPLWTYEMRIHVDYKSSMRRPVLALLTTPARMASSDPERPHWISAQGERTLLICHLDNGMRWDKFHLGRYGAVTTFTMDEEFIVLPTDVGPWTSGTPEIHVFSRKHNTHIVSFPMTPDGAALATSVSFSHLTHAGLALNVPFGLPGSAVWRTAHELALRTPRADWEAAQHCNTGRNTVLMTRGVLAYVTYQGALVIVRGYRDMLRCFRREPRGEEEMHRSVRKRTYLVSSKPRFEHIVAHNERLLVQTRVGKQVALTLHTPHLPPLSRRVPQTFVPADPSPAIYDPMPSPAAVGPMHPSDSAGRALHCRLVSLPARGLVSMDTNAVYIPRATRRERSSPSSPRRWMGGGMGGGAQGYAPLPPAQLLQLWPIPGGWPNHPPLINHPPPQSALLSQLPPVPSHMPHYGYPAMNTPWNPATDPQPAVPPPRHMYVPNPGFVAFAWPPPGHAGVYQLPWMLVPAPSLGMHGTNQATTPAAANGGQNGGGPQTNGHATVHASPVNAINPVAVMHASSIPAYLQALHAQQPTNAAQQTTTAPRADLSGRRTRAQCPSPQDLVQVWRLGERLDWRD